MTEISGTKRKVVTVMLNGRDKNSIIRKDCRYIDVKLFALGEFMPVCINI